MAEVLAGETYPGTALVADVAVAVGLPRDGSALIATPAGYVLLAPLPDDRWITFVGDLDDDEAERLPARHIDSRPSPQSWPGASLARWSS